MSPLDQGASAAELAMAQPGRFEGIRRDYTPEEVARLSGSVRIEHTLAELGARRLWELLHTRPYVACLGALTGNQAMQMVRAGLESIYLSGWQVAADANLAGQVYPDQSLYPANSVPAVVKRINQALERADQIQHMEGKGDTYWYAPIIADAEAGFGGPLNAFELMKAMIEAGAAAVHFEDQLASEKKCGHLGGKVLVPMQGFIRTLNAARLAADVCGTSTLVVARTDAESAQLITSDIDERDHAFIERGVRTPEGFYRIKRGVGVDYCIARGLAYAPYADMLWWETSRPDLEEARRFAEAIHAALPGQAPRLQLLAQLQLERQSEAAGDRALPGIDRSPGLQVPVHHAGGLPQPQLCELRARPRLPRARHGRILRAAGGRVRRGGGRLHRGQAPARGRHRLLRRGQSRDLRRTVGDHRAQGLDRSPAVPLMQKHQPRRIPP